MDNNQNLCTFKNPCTQSSEGYGCFIQIICKTIWKNTRHETTVNISTQLLGFLFKFRCHHHRHPYSETIHHKPGTTWKLIQLSPRFIRCGFEFRISSLSHTGSGCFLKFLRLTQRTEDTFLANKSSFLNMLNSTTHVATKYDIHITFTNLHVSTFYIVGYYDNYLSKNRDHIP